MVLGNWLGIVVIFATVAAWLNPLTMVAAVILLAGRQLALSVLMHGCGHRTLFRSTRLSDVIGQWLCALPVMSDQSPTRGVTCSTTARPEVMKIPICPITRPIQYRPQVSAASLSAPCGVNFHMEHHFMASVPCYKLKELRQHLRRRHALDQVPEFRGYGQLLRHVVVKRLLSRLPSQNCVVTGVVPVFIADMIGAILDGLHSIIGSDRSEQRGCIHANRACYSSRSPALLEAQALNNKLSAGGSVSAKLSVQTHNNVYGARVVGKKLPRMSVPQNSRVS